MSAKVRVLGEDPEVPERLGRREPARARLDLIPLEALEAMGEAFGRGEARYGRLDANRLLANWAGLDLASDKSPLNHALKHLAQFAAGETDEDHLGHALANVAMLAWFQRNTRSPYRGWTHPEILAGEKGEQA